MASIIPSGLSQLFRASRDSRIANLERRLEMTTVQKQPLLEQEPEASKEVATVRPIGLLSVAQWLRFVRKGIADLIMGDSEPEIIPYQSNGDQWWYTLDPRTGRCVYRNSKAELRLWIQERYQRR